MIFQVGRRYVSAVLIVSLVASLILLQGCMKPANGVENEDETEASLSIPVEAAMVVNSDVAAFY